MVTPIPGLWDNILPISLRRPVKANNYVPIAIQLDPSNVANDNILVYVGSLSKFYDLLLVDKDGFITLVRGTPIG